MASDSVSVTHALISYLTQVAQHEIVPGPLTNLPFEHLRPGSAELNKLRARFR